LWMKFHECSFIHAIVAAVPCMRTRWLFYREACDQRRLEGLLASLRLCASWEAGFPGIYSGYSSTSSVGQTPNYCKKDGSNSGSLPAVGGQARITVAAAALQLQVTNGQRRSTFPDSKAGVVPATRPSAKLPRARVGTRQWYRTRKLFMQPHPDSSRR
jgi:hypothetical protein